MDAETLQALKDSIEHWKENLAAEIPAEASTGTNFCALCRVFYENDCQGCPVMEKTGKWECNDSPYGAATAAYSRWRTKETNKYRSDWRKAAKTELDFLKSLLPEGEK